MKRNKAIKTIRKVLKSWEGSQLDNECANEILTALEDLGILPPRYLKRKSRKGKFYEVNGRWTNKTIPIYLNEWEK